MIVDTHVHVISADRSKYPLQLPAASVVTMPQSLSHLWFQEVPLTVERLAAEMDDASVDRAVIVQPVSAYSYDNRYAADSARRYPNRFVSICIIDMLASEAPERLTECVTTWQMSGIRLFTGSKEGGQWLDDERTFPVWERAKSLGVPVCVQIYPRHFPRLRNVLARFADVPVAVDHMAMVNVDHQPPADDVSAMLALATFPNLYVKFSTLNIDPSKGAAGQHLFERTVERFGARRLTWGSNYPASHERSYQEQVALARSAVSPFTAEEQTWLLGETALSLWPALGQPSSA